MNNEKLREAVERKDEKKDTKHKHCWIDNLYCRTHRKKLTDDEIFDMGYNYAISNLKPVIDLAEQYIAISGGGAVLKEHEIRDKIFQFFYDKGLSKKYRDRCKCVDGCMECDGTGYILNGLGMALYNLPQTIHHQTILSLMKNLCEGCKEKIR